MPMVTVVTAMTMATFLEYFTCMLCPQYITRRCYDPVNDVIFLWFSGYIHSWFVHQYTTYHSIIYLSESMPSNTIVYMLKLQQIHHTSLISKIITRFPFGGVFCITYVQSQYFKYRKSTSDLIGKNSTTLYLISTISKIITTNNTFFLNLLLLYFTWSTISKLIFVTTNNAFLKQIRKVTNMNS